MTISFSKVAQGVCSIVINRPAKRNALNLETILKLRGALEKFEQDDEFHVAVISGSQGNFCAGYDLKEFVDPATGIPDIRQIELMLWPLGTRLSERKITIAAIEGYAAGFGFELALKCDFRVSERDSKMGFLNRRLGIPIMNGGTVILPQLLGLARAKEMVCTGKAQLAPEALEYGLLTHITDIGCALGRAINIARSLVKFDQQALLHDLKSTVSTRSNELELLQMERSRSLDYLMKCGPLEPVSKFISGQLFRHGSFDMGNLIAPEPEVTL